MGMLISHTENLSACPAPAKHPACGSYCEVLGAHAVVSTGFEGKRKPKAWHRNQTSNLPNKPNPPTLYSFVLQWSLDVFRVIQKLPGIASTGITDLLFVMNAPPLHCTCCP